MYHLDLIKTTSLAKKLGGPPIFHDGFLRSIEIYNTTMLLDIEILSQSNPLLQSDTRVILKLNDIESFSLFAQDIARQLIVIHDLDIRKEGSQLRMILESTDGMISEVVFGSIELTDKEQG